MPEVRLGLGHGIKALVSGVHVGLGLLLFPGELDVIGHRLIQPLAQLRVLVLLGHDEGLVVGLLLTQLLFELLDLPQKLFFSLEPYTDPQKSVP